MQYNLKLNGEEVIIINVALHQLMTEEIDIKTPQKMREIRRLIQKVKDLQNDVMINTKPQKLLPEGYSDLEAHPEYW